MMLSAKRDWRDVVERFARATAVHAGIRKDEADRFGRYEAAEPFGAACNLRALLVAISYPPCGLRGAFAIAESGLPSLAFLGDGSARGDPLAVSLLVVPGASPLALWIEPVARRARARFAERLSGDVSSEQPSAARACLGVSSDPVERSGRPDGRPRDARVMRRAVRPPLVAAVERIATHAARPRIRSYVEQSGWTRVTAVAERSVVVRVAVRHAAAETGASEGRTAGVEATAIGVAAQDASEMWTLTHVARACVVSTATPPRCRSR